MFGHQFYHGTIRKYIIMFGNMFNDINIDRFDKSGNIIQSLNVPIAYGPREKFLSRLREDPNLNQEVATILPRLSFEITNISYDQVRTINKMHNISSRGAGADVLASTSTPIPYDINITLNGMFATNEDAVQVVEQILPFFRPEWTHSLRLVDDLSDHYIDVPTILNDMTITDSYEADFQTRRAIIYTFNFTLSRVTCTDLLRIVVLLKERLLTCTKVIIPQLMRRESQLISNRVSNLMVLQRQTEQKV
jgi:hypothetical protein